MTIYNKECMLCRYGDEKINIVIGNDIRDADQLGNDYVSLDIYVDDLSAFIETALENQKEILISKILRQEE